MSPLIKGAGSFRRNVQELMNSPVQSSARKKGIQTIAKTRNVSRGDAKFIQAQGIAKSQMRKK